MHDPDPKCRHFGILWHFGIFAKKSNKKSNPIFPISSDFFPFFRLFPTFRFSDSTTLVAIHLEIHISIPPSSAAPTFWWSFHCMRCSRCSMLPLLQPVHFHNNGQSAEDYSSRQGKFINAPNAPDATHSVLPRQKAVVIYFCIATYLLRVAPVLGLQEEQWSCVRLRCWWADCWQFIWL